MYQFSGKLKMFSLALIVLGLMATGWSFYDGLSKTKADAEAAIAAEHNDGHGGGHSDAKVDDKTKSKTQLMEELRKI